MSRNPKLGTHTGECLLCRKLGRSAPPLTLEMSQSSFPAWAAAGTPAASLLPILNQRGPSGRRGPSKQSSSPFLGFALSLRIAQVCGTAPRWGKLRRKEGARPGYSLLPPYVPSPPRLPPCSPYPSVPRCDPPQLPKGLQAAPTFRTPRPYPPDCLRGPSVLCRRRGAVARRTRTTRPARSTLLAVG